jgi:hypothetical protein
MRGDWPLADCRDEPLLKITGTRTTGTFFEDINSKLDPVKKIMLQPAKVNRPITSAGE